MLKVNDKLSEAAPDIEMRLPQWQVPMPLLKTFGPARSGEAMPEPSMARCQHSKRGDRPAIARREGQ